MIVCDLCKRTAESVPSINQRKIHIINRIGEIDDTTIDMCIYCSIELNKRLHRTEANFYREKIEKKAVE